MSVYCINILVINYQSRQVAVLGMVWGWSWVVCWLRGMVWSCWFVFWVLGNTVIFNISNVSTISIYVIGNDLGTAIRKSNTVLTSSGITFTVFISRERGLGVIILDGITVLVNSWAIIGRFVIRSWLVVSRGWVYNWLVNNWGNIWSWFVDNWGMIRCWSWGMIRCWFVDNWGMIRCWSWVVYWSSFVNWSWVIYWSMVNWSWVIWSSMVDWSWVIWGGVVNWDMSWGMDSSSVLFTSIRVVYVLGSSMRLASNNSVVSTMCFVDRVTYSRGIAVFHSLVA